MRLFTTNTPKTSPELVRHSNVAADKVVVGGTNPPEAGGGQGTPPRYLHAVYSRPATWFQGLVLTVFLGLFGLVMAGILLEAVNFQ